ncbi:uncharacterized protein LOC134797333 [Cydia splendana]|uniref:uncharacterized protein LOC134797333 n=1 Tax=Cydia splendana TaxID=1100963 RepID=UPI00300C6F99
MEAVLQPPAPFLFENNISSVTSGNLSKAWQNWKNAFNIYCEACELHKKDEKVKTNILLHVIGPKCREVYQQFSVKPTTLQALLKEFDDFFLPKTNTTVERHRFFTREQKSQESAEQYVFELNKMAAKCGFKDLCDDLVKDRLICGIRNTTLRERLLREPDLKLSSALDICRLVEMSQVQASTIKPESETHHVHELSTNCGTSSNGRHEDVEEALVRRGVRPPQPPPPAPGSRAGAAGAVADEEEVVALLLQSPYRRTGIQGLDLVTSRLIIRDHIKTVRPPDRWGYTDTHRGN